MMRSAFKSNPKLLGFLLGRSDHHFQLLLPPLLSHLQQLSETSKPNLPRSSILSLQMPAYKLAPLSRLLGGREIRMVPSTPCLPGTWTISLHRVIPIFNTKTEFFPSSVIINLYGHRIICYPQMLPDGVSPFPVAGFPTTRQDPVTARGFITHLAVLVRCLALSTIHEIGVC